MKKEKLEKLALEQSNPCVTISMNTHRTHPDNLEDAILLKNLLKEAETRLVNEFGKRPIQDLLAKIATIEEEVDVDYNLDSLHIFLSNTTQEIVRSPLPTNLNRVQISDKFAIKPLINMLNHSEEYLILMLSQSGVHLYRAMNDAILDEIKNQDFPFSQNTHYLTAQDKLSDAKLSDNMVREYLNGVDKALVKVFNETNKKTVIVATETNHSHLMHVADKPSVYYGYVTINYNDLSKHKLATDAWKLISEKQAVQSNEAINEMQEAVGQGKVITDLGDIFRAVKEGRGELLISSIDFSQSVKMTGDNSFDLVSDVTVPGVVDDIISEIAWEVISKKGRAIFTEESTINGLGEIALKVRY